MKLGAAKTEYLNVRGDNVFETIEIKTKSCSGWFVIMFDNTENLLCDLRAKPIQVKDSPKNANIINGPGVRIIKSCSSQAKSSQVLPSLTIKLS